MWSTSLRLSQEGQIRNETAAFRTRKNINMLIAPRLAQSECCRIVNELKRKPCRALLRTHPINRSHRFLSTTTGQALRKGVKPSWLGAVVENVAAIWIAEL
jgi:hypothetical protein